MSMCWYLYSYPIEIFNQVFGSATKAQARKLMNLLNDPDEGIEDDEEREIAIELAEEMLNRGIDMGRKSEEQKSVMDHILALAMNRLGLGKELKVKPRSPEPVTLKVAAELVRNAPAVDAKLLGLFDRGRRFGLTEGRQLDSYFFLKPEEIIQLKNEVARLLANPNVKWPHPDFPKAIQSNLAEPLAKVAESSEDGLYAQLG